MKCIECGQTLEIENYPREICNECYYDEQWHYDYSEDDDDEHEYDDDFEN